MHSTLATSALLALLPLTSLAHYHQPKNFDITVGADAQLKFNPDRVRANVGDTLTFSFFPKKHSVTSSSFASPCKPQGGDTQINSGFQPVTPEQKEGNQTFVVTVRDEKPIWLYCAQTVGNHCQMGMNMVVNEPADPAKSLDKYRELAKNTAPSEIPPTMGNGVFRPNIKYGNNNNGNSTYHAPPPASPPKNSDDGKWDGKTGKDADNKYDGQNKDGKYDAGDKDSNKGSVDYNKKPSDYSEEEKKKLQEVCGAFYQGGANGYVRARALQK